MMQLAMTTPTAAPKGTSPKHGPFPSSLLMKVPNCGPMTRAGLNGEHSVKTYPKYQVVRQSTTTLPSMFSMPFSLGFLFSST